MIKINLFFLCFANASPLIFEGSNGRKALNKIWIEAEKKGYWTLYSSIFSVNEGSINLHKKCGFRVIGTREKIAKDKFGNWQSTTIMEWRNRIE